MNAPHLFGLTLDTAPGCAEVAALLPVGSTAFFDRTRAAQPGDVIAVRLDSGEYRLEVQGDSPAAQLAGVMVYAYERRPVSNWTP